MAPRARPAETVRSLRDDKPSRLASGRGVHRMVEVGRGRCGETDDIRLGQISAAPPWFHSRRLTCHWRDRPRQAARKGTWAARPHCRCTPARHSGLSLRRRRGSAGSPRLQAIAEPLRRPRSLGAQNRPVRLRVKTGVTDDESSSSSSRSPRRATTPPTSAAAGSCRRQAGRAHRRC